MADHTIRQSGSCSECRSPRRLRFHRMQEHDAVLVLDRVEVHVGDVRMLRGELRQLEVMRGEQRVGSDSSRAGGARSPRPAPGRRRSRCRGRSRPSARGCARWRCCRIAAASVISTMKVERPPARSSAAPMRVKIAVDRAERARLRRHEAAALREQRDQRHLAHVGRLAAHVRAGDRAAAGASAREAAVVGDEVLDLALDHRMAARLDVDAARRRTPAAPVVALRPRSAKRGEHIELRRAPRRSPAAPAMCGAERRRAARRTAASRARARAPAPRAPCPRTPSARA